MKENIDTEEEKNDIYTESIEKDEKNNINENNVNDENQNINKNNNVKNADKKEKNNKNNDIKNVDDEKENGLSSMLYMAAEEKIRQLEYYPEQDKTRNADTDYFLDYLLSRNWIDYKNRAEY